MAPPRIRFLHRVNNRSVGLDPTRRNGIVRSVEFGEIADQLAVRNSPFSFSPLVINLTGATIVFSMVGTLPTGLSINSGTGAITGAPTVNGTTTGLQIRATYAGRVSESNSFSIEVYTIPSITAIANQSSEVGAAFSFTPTVSNPSGFTLTYSIIGTLPDGLTINSSTGEISGTTTTDQTVSGLILRITYSHGIVDSNAFDFTITSDNFVIITGNATDIDTATFGSTTLSPVNVSKLSNWIAKINIETQAVVWATKCLEYSGAGGAFTTLENVATFADGSFVVNAVIEDNGTVYVYDTTSATVPKATITAPAIILNSALIKYSSAGVFQWARLLKSTRASDGIWPSVPGVDGDITSATHLVAKNDGSIISTLNIFKFNVGLSGTYQVGDGTTFENILSSEGPNDTSNREGAIIQLDEDGYLDGYRISNITASTGGQNPFNLGTEISRRRKSGLGFAVAHSVGGFTANGSLTVEYGDDEPNYFTNTTANIPLMKTAIAKYDESMNLQWIADTTAEVASSAPLTSDAWAAGVEIADDGDVYSGGFVKCAGGADNTLTVRSRGWTTPQVNVLIPNNIGNDQDYAPYYEARDTDGYVKWAHSLGVSSASGAAKLSDITVVDGYAPFMISEITGTQIFDEGFASQQTLDRTNSPFPTFQISQLNPDDGYITQITTINSTSSTSAIAKAARLCPILPTKLAVIVPPNGISLVFGAGEAGETTINHLLTLASTSSVALYDAQTSELIFAKQLPTSLTSSGGTPTVSVFGIASSST